MKKPRTSYGRYDCGDKGAARLTPVEIEAIWRPTPAFVGPVAPPMWLWERRGSVIKLFGSPGVASLPAGVQTELFW